MTDDGRQMTEVRWQRSDDRRLTRDEKVSGFRFQVSGVSVDGGRQADRLIEKETFGNSDAVEFAITPTFRLRSASYDGTRRPDKPLEPA
jgi:hypothetical protein